MYAPTYTKLPARGAARRAVQPRARSLFVPLLIAAVSCAHAGDLYVACSTGVSLSMADVRDVFLGEKQFAGAVKLTPVENSVLQADFLDKVIKMDPNKYATAWIKKSFRDGTTAPALKGGDGEVIEFLKHTPGGCGYVGAAPPSGLTLVGKL